MTTERFARLLASGLLADFFEPHANLDNRSGVRDAHRLGPLQPKARRETPSTAVIPVDHSLTLEQMIAAGNYDWRNEDISSNHFAVAGEGRSEYESKLFHFEGGISSPEAEKRIRTADVGHPWLPARIEHLLAFGAKHPEEQRKHPIVGLGSVGDPSFFGQCNVPYLYRRITGRSLHLDWWSTQWPSLYRFLAVRK